MSRDYSLVPPEWLDMVKRADEVVPPPNYSPLAPPEQLPALEKPVPQNRPKNMSMGQPSVVPPGEDIQDDLLEEQPEEIKKQRKEQIKKEVDVYKKLQEAKMAQQELAQQQKDQQKLKLANALKERENNLRNIAMQEGFSEIAQGLAGKYSGTATPPPSQALGTLKGVEQQGMNVLRDQLKAIDKAGASGKGTWQQTNYVQDGKVYTGKFNTSTGEIIPVTMIDPETGKMIPVERGYAAKMFTHKGTGDTYRVNSDGSIQKVTNIKQTTYGPDEIDYLRNNPNIAHLKPEHAKAATKLLERFDKALKDPKQRAREMERIRTLVKSDNPAAGGVIVNLLARTVAGEKGPLTEGDIRRVAGSPALSASIARFSKKYYDGKLTDQDKTDFLELVKDSDLMNRMEMFDVNNHFSSQLGSIMGVDQSNLANKDMLRKMLRIESSKPTLPSQNQVRVRINGQDVTISREKYEQLKEQSKKRTP